MTILVGHSICQGLNTSLGNPTETVDARGLWEDWCGEPGDTWLFGAFLADPINVTIEGCCASFGGQLTWDPVIGTYARGGLQTPYGGRFAEPDRPVNLHGKTLIFRMNPMRGTAEFGYIALFDSTTENDPFMRMEYFLGASARIDITALGATTDDSVTVAGYDPDGAHAWWSIGHDEITGNVVWRTSPDCGTWTTHHDALVDSPMSNLAIELWQEADNASAAGSISELYIVDTNPS